MERQVQFGYLKRILIIFYFFALRQIQTSSGPAKSLHAKCGHNSKTAGIHEWTAVTAYQDDAAEV